MYWYDELKISTNKYLYKYLRRKVKIQCCIKTKYCIKIQSFVNWILRVIKNMHCLFSTLPLFFDSNLINFISDILSVHLTDIASSLLLFNEAEELNRMTIFFYFSFDTNFHISYMCIIITTFLMSKNLSILKFLQDG